MKKLITLLAGCTLAFAATADVCECTVTDKTDNGHKFTKQQVAGRLRQLKLLYEDGRLTDEFYDERVAECETAS